MKNCIDRIATKAIKLLKDENKEDVEMFRGFLKEYPHFFKKSVVIDELSSKKVMEYYHDIDALEKKEGRMLAYYCLTDEEIKNTKKFK